MKLPIHCKQKRRHSGFTLVEMLVVITIIVVLAAISFTAFSHAKLAAAKTTGMTQMRNIGVAVAVYASDNSLTDFFYYTNGTGDYYNERGNGSKFNPGNPAQALYNVQSPESGYIQDFSVFFSPLAKFKLPAKKDYDPTKASESKPWGTYAWFYPYARKEKLTGPQVAHVSFPIETAINPAIEGRYMMSEAYPAAMGPKFAKPIYHALMNDGSVQYIGDSSAVYNKWKTGQ